jgi:DNA-binding transcriptional regulator YiaG
MSAARKGRRSARPVWNAGSVRRLRRHLGASQEELADELGVRQQTVSEWETGRYEPRGASNRLLSIVAERAGFAYSAQSPMPAEMEAPAEEPSE